MNLNSNIAEVAIPLPIHKIFTYSIPDHINHSICIGSRVIVPFGNRKIIGYVVKLSQRSTLAELKKIVNVMDKTPLFPEEMVPLFKWISYYYIHPLGKVIKTALPTGLSYSTFTKICLLKSGKIALKSKLLSESEKKILITIKKGPKTLEKITEITGNKISKPLLRKIEQKKWVKLTNTTKFSKICTKKIRYVSNVLYSGTNKISPQRKKILAQLEMNGDMVLRDLLRKAKTTYKLIQKMEKDKQIRTYNHLFYKSVLGDFTTQNTPLKLTQEQQNAINIAGKPIGKKFTTFLLAGVTGSGKTEVYLRLTKIALEKKLTVLVLTPEINLISQLEHSFKSHFGNCVATLHSNLSKTELHTEWLRILKKKATIAVGTRSCVFAPLTNLGLVIVDEEHDPSYKQNRAPFYNGKDVAIIRAKYCKAVVVLGSATPSIQSWFNVQTGKFIDILMTDRVQKRSLPKVDIVNISNNRNIIGASRYFDASLIKQINSTLEKGQQTLLFLNRRGFATFPVCIKCGSPVQCKNCNISLTLHQNKKLLMCHYCGFSKPHNSVCSFCKSPKIRFVGIGTEKLEVMVKNMFPKARVSRMDRDTTKKKGSIIKILKALKNREIDILVGTQMVTKGHDFPGITLVGIICADLAMNFPDFRSSERTFQLLSQVAGRAGRGNFPGKVILQTYNPEHFSILAAKKQDFKTFYTTEIEFRRALAYPPFSRMIQIKMSGRNASKVSKHAHTILQKCNDILRKHNDHFNKIEILGPIEAPLAKIQTFYRWKIIIKGTNSSELHKFITNLNSSKVSGKNISIKTSIDVDPISIM